MGVGNLKKSDVFGNNPRKVMSSSDMDDLIELRKAATSESLKDFLSKTIILNDLMYKNVDDAIHRLFFIKTDADLCNPSLAYVSTYIQCLISRSYEFLKLDSAYKNYTNSLSTGNPSLVGINYETLFHTYFNQPSGCTIKIEYQIKRENKDFKCFPFERSCLFSVKKYYKTNQLDSFSLFDGCYHSPVIFNFPTFDSVFKGKVKQKYKTRRTPLSKDVVFFFQCTTGPQHTIKNDGYSLIRDCLNLPNISEVALLFIVPKCFESFKPVLTPPLNFEDIDDRITMYLASPDL
jgi:hypothetical protein